MPNCPRCGQHIGELKTEYMETPGRNDVRVLFVICPNPECSTVLGVLDRSNRG